MASAELAPNPIPEYDEKENKQDVVERVFTLYNNRRFSVFQSVVNRHCTNSPTISKACHYKLMENICELFDSLENARNEFEMNDSKEQFSYTNYCFDLVKTDTNHENEIASVAAFYYGTLPKKNIERIAKKKESDKKDDDDEETKEYELETGINLMVHPNEITFDPILMKYYTKPIVNKNIMVLIHESTGKESKKKNEELFGDWQTADWFENVSADIWKNYLRKKKYLKADSTHYSTDNVFELPPKLNEKLTVGLIGDWGSGTEVARDLLQILLEKHSPDILIHLGDVYYAGDTYEFRENYSKILNEKREKHKCVVFSVPGNHDYYSKGAPFYKMIEELNGSKYVPHWFKGKQTKSFFVIKNKYWQLQGMDTGNEDADPLAMKAGHYPGLQETEALYHQHHIINRGKRNILLFSHHPLFSAFEAVGTKKKKKKVYYNNKLSGKFTVTDDSGHRSGLLKYITAWYWGHEHHFAIYDKNTNKSGKEQVLAKGRLLGHSAVPLKVKDKSIQYIKPHRQDAYPLINTKDDVPVCIKPSNDGKVFNHGYAILELKEDSAKTTYWEIDAAGYTTESKQTYTEDLLK